ncbi:uncharacterized protein LOC118435024 [Folsomia candida]|uniref:uncharacterized protein LOC118435024 n=1 Tax=Folsomia candida TaxID=158441 RepID=UPI001604E04A|nr:uncharacterized protein LOC118435024 [Folsomia candida]
MGRTVAFLLYFSNISKAEIFAFFNLALRIFWLLGFLTEAAAEGPVNSDEEKWNYGLLGFFMSYLLPLLMGILLLDGVRHRNMGMCKLWLIYQIAVFVGCGVILFMANWTLTLSSRKMTIVLSSILFKTIGMWIVLDFLRQFEDQNDCIVTLTV